MCVFIDVQFYPKWEMKNLSTPLYSPNYHPQVLMKNLSPPFYSPNHHPQVQIIHTYRSIEFHHFTVFLRTKRNPPPLPRHLKPSVAVWGWRTTFPAAAAQWAVKWPGAKVGQGRVASGGGGGKMKEISMKNITNTRNQRVSETNSRWRRHKNKNKPEPALGGGEGLIGGGGGSAVKRRKFRRRILGWRYKSRTE